MAPLPLLLFLALALAGLTVPGASAPADESAVPKKTLPSWVPVCKRSDPDLEGCVQRAVETLRPRLGKGISKLRIPPLEPFELPSLHVSRDLNALQVNATLKDIYVLGAGDFQLRSLRIDLDALKMEAEILLPHLQVRCRYDVKGRLLTMPLLGRGNFRGNFSDVVVKARGSGKLTTTDGGPEHLRATDLAIKARVGGSNIDFDNDDPEAAAIAETVLQFVRGNTAAVLEVVMPVVEETANEVGLQLVNPILERLPYSEILPDE